jgi:hypothetical protein
MMTFNITTSSKEAEEIILNKQNTEEAKDFNLNEEPELGNV